jgi:hypothetical protein
VANQRRRRKRSAVKVQGLVQGRAMVVQARRVPLLLRIRGRGEDVVDVIAVIATIIIFVVVSIIEIVVVIIFFVVVDIIIIIVIVIITRVVVVVISRATHGSSRRGDR